MPDWGYKPNSQKALVLEVMGVDYPADRDWWSAWDLAAVIHSVHGGDVIRFLKHDGWVFDEDERTSQVTGKRYKVWRLRGLAEGMPHWAVLNPPRPLELGQKNCPCSVLPILPDDVDVIVDDEGQAAFDF